MDQTDTRQKAYRAGARVAKERMAGDAPLDARALEMVEASDVVVVGGCYDHVEKVLDALEMPYTPLAGEQLGAIRLNPDQLLVVNCPGDLPRGVIAGIEEFVASGGSLFTTDWALRHVVQAAFPGTISYGGRPTHDDVVRIELTENDNPFLSGVVDGRDDPQWWLEASSYPIHIDDPDRVQVLMRSRELEEKYGESPVAVLFPHGKGEVFHMISHYYLQRTELRSERHAAPASSWAAEKGVDMSADLMADMDGISLGEVESAGTSARLFANLVAQKKRKAQEKE
jgi:hypothetical protein